jgi:hypothetical protein
VRAHVHDAVQQTLLERFLRARVDVLNRERLLDRRRALHVIGRTAVLERRDAVEDP